MQKQLTKWQTNEASRALGRGDEGGEGAEKDCGEGSGRWERRRNGGRVGRKSRMRRGAKE